MFERFDDFAKQYENEKNGRKDAPAQWEFLKHCVSQLSSQHNSFDGHPFDWNVDDGAAILCLKEVAAQFIDESKRDFARKGYRIRFGQRPLGAHEAYSEPLVHSEEWELKPSVLEDEFVWLVDGKRYLPEHLAEAVALMLTSCLEEFEEARRL
jgi:hypothetical protein